MKLALPRLIGHRGACAYAPENTLESLRTAVEMGCKWIALDVRTTRDSVPFVIHDETLDRTTNGFGKVAERHSSELRDLEAGSWFGGSFSGIKIPTLEDALDVIYQHNLGLFLNIHTEMGRDVDTAESVLDILSQSWENPERLILSSPSVAVLETAIEMAEEWPRNLPLIGEWEHNWQDIADHLKVSTLTVEASVDLDKLRDLDTDQDVIAGPTDDPLLAKRLIQAGVSSILTSAPDVVAEGLPRVH